MLELRCSQTCDRNSENREDHPLPDNHLVAFSTYLTKQMACMCVCVSEKETAILDFVRVDRSQKKIE